jgi:pSer/pThr/pTyr-binding forkhead associated (FHA) protein
VDGSTWDCLSCGARAQHKPFCEQCGAAQPVEGGEDSALSMMLGLVCESCDAYNDPGVSVCTSCGKPLGDGGPSVDPEPVAPVHVPPALASPATTRPWGGEPDVETETMRASELAAAAARAREASASPPVFVASSTSEPPADAGPSWMTPPTGKPLATAFALPKVDLASVASSPSSGLAAPASRAQPPTAAPPVASPVVATPAVAPCSKCGTQLQPGDKFCRNCGTRVGEGTPVATTQIAAVKMPGPGLPSPMLPPGATMMMPGVPQVGGARTQAAPAGASGPSATMFFGAVTAERSAKLVLVRGQSQFGSQWRLQAGETSVGRSHGQVLFPDDEALAARHCRLVFRGSELWLEPDATTNGVFLRVRERARLAPGDEVVIGAQRLRVLADVERPILAQSHDDTRVLGSLMKPATPIALLCVAPDPRHNEVYFRAQRLLTIGRNNCDLNFPRDSFVSERHAQLSVDADGLLLEDLRSRNGTYLRARAPVALQHGDLMLLGDKVLRVELPR